MSETNKYQCCLYNKHYLELHELETEFYQDKFHTREKYKGKLLCPDCHKVQLAIKENNNGIFLSAYPKSTHDKTCEYLLSVASKKELQIFYESINPTSAERMLERVLEDAPSSPITLLNQNSIQNVNEYCPCENPDSKKTIIRKYLPRRSLQLREMEEKDYLVMYYGKCKLFLVQNKFNDFYLRIFRDDESNKYLCSLKLPKKIYFFLEEKLRFIPNEKELQLENSRNKAVSAKLAFVAKIDKNGYYYNGVLTHSKLLNVFPQ